MKDKIVNIDFKYLYLAYCSGSWEKRYYLNTKTGALPVVYERTRKRLQDVYDEVGEDSAEKHIDVDDVELLEAHEIEMDDSLYLKVPERKLALDDYDQFAQTREPAIRRLLWSALDMHDYAKFERVLMMEERSGHYASWHAYLEKIAQPELTKWLRHHNIFPRWQ